jgi:hypothetical protein
MPCTGRFAEAWQYAAYACVGKLLTGVDNGVGVGVAYLTDSYVDFVANGFFPNEGMPLYNTTLGTSGAITSVTHHTLTATGVLWTTGQAYRAIALSAQERGVIEHYLNLGAGNISAALGAAGACSCTFSVWGANFLADLNILIAMAFYNCPCGSPQLTVEEKRMYIEQINRMLDQIRTGQIDVCNGATGSDYPAWGIIQSNWTDFSAVQLVINQLLKKP